MSTLRVEVKMGQLKPLWDFFKLKWGQLAWLNVGS